MATAVMVGALQSRHAGIERDIATELRQSEPDAEKVARLKREKQRITEELATVRYPSHSRAFAWAE